MSEVKKWMGSKPEACDLCRSKFGKVFYDANVPWAQRWGLVCQKCFSHYGCKLGTGAGQKYSTETLEKLGG